MNPDSRMEMDTTVDESAQDLLLDVELKELGRISWSASEKQPFLKGVQFSPDGNLILTAVNAQGLKLIDLPRDLIEAEQDVPCEFHLKA